MLGSLRELVGRSALRSGLLALRSPLDSGRAPLLKRRQLRATPRLSTLPLDTKVQGIRELHSCTLTRHCSWVRVHRGDR
jgi:hypothetical protein